MTKSTSMYRIGKCIQLSETMGMFSYLPFAQETPYAGGFVIRTMGTVTNAGLAGVAREATKIVPWLVARGPCKLSEALSRVPSGALWARPR